MSPGIVYRAAFKLFPFPLSKFIITLTYDKYKSIPSSERWDPADLLNCRLVAHLGE